MYQGGENEKGEARERILRHNTQSWLLGKKKKSKKVKEKKEVV